MPIKVLGVGGSMRANSHSNRMVALALESAAVLGAETRFFDLRALDLPMYRPDVDATEDSIRAAAEAVAWADAFVLGTPDYHGSMSGALKNFLDYHWEGFSGKLFGYLCASHEKGLTAMDQVRTAVRQCYGWSLPYGVALHGKEDLDVDGQFKNPKQKHRIQMMARDLVVYGTLLRRQFEADLSGEELETFAAHYR